MNTPVSLKDKKDFITWVLNHLHFKKRESVWILHYLLGHETILENIHFVNEAKFCPRGLIMSTICSGDVPFRYYKSHIVTTDSDKTFHDIRMNQDQPLYIEINFKHAHKNARYVSVLEENPYLPEDYFLSEEDIQHAHQLLDISVYLFQKKRLKSKIDVALDQGDKKEFLRLSRALKQLEENKNQPPSC
ncbi:MAG TPA: ReoY family proteolytic degradation factor [Cerasibacillus sp.]|uniref:ReoY family proteolytic degradation factor n=1 Tax=Cerasibacillus sp. TaxID=2498711 RepID=UPI002F3ED7A5